LETIFVGRPFQLVVADTGVASSTRIVVGDVGQSWERDPERYERLFDEIGAVTRAARQAIEVGDLAEIGALMNENQGLLQELDVSSPELETLIRAALAAGAVGAKLSGAGRGGNMIALVTDGTATGVERALREAGAHGVIVTEVSSATDRRSP
jgi:mevalonate kinase